MPQLIREDVQLLIKAGLIIMLIMLFVNLRSLKAVIMVFIVIIPSLIAMMGFMGWAYKITGLTCFLFALLNTSMPIILLTIANSDGVHVITKFFRQFRRFKDGLALYKKNTYFSNETDNNIGKADLTNIVEAFLENFSIEEVIKQSKDSANKRFKSKQEALTFAKENFEKIIESLRELYMLNFFSTVNPQILEVKDKTQIDVIIDVIEKESGRANFSMGYNELHD